MNTLNLTVDCPRTHKLMLGGRELLDKLKKDSDLAANTSVNQGLEDMSLLFDYLDALGASKRVSYITFSH